MASRHGTSSILTDLALLYITLAHGTDQAFNGAEVDEIARRLRDMQTDVNQGTVIGALTEAIDEYTSEDATRRIAEAVRSVRESAPEKMRRRILVDLAAIASSDGRIASEERRLIRGLAAAWGMPPPAEMQ